MGPSALVVAESLFAYRFLVTHLHAQVVVGSDTELDSAVGVALTEDNRVLRTVGKYPRFYGQRLVVPVAVAF